MKISFVIPAYNEEKLLGACLASIERELARTSCDAEVIVVNNASTDGTSAVALAYPRVCLVDECEKGIVFARRAGFVASSGDLIANVDADTVLPAGWVATVLDEFQARPSIVALSGPHIYHDLSLFQRAASRVFYMGGYAVYFVNHRIFKKGGMLQGGNFVVRRSALIAIGGFDTSIIFYGEDTDLARRLAEVGRVHFTFKLPLYASGRRLAKEGLLLSGYRYALNFFSTLFFKRPVTTAYEDIRP